MKGSKTHQKSPLPGNFKVDPSFVPLDGDGFASWLTKQDEVKAGTVTPAMQQKYATEIRAAKLEEFKSYLDNDAIRLTDRRKLGRDVNFLTGALGLLRFPGQVCLGPADRQPYRTRYGFRVVAQCAANRYWDLFHLDLKTAFQSVIPIGCCSVASGHWLATLDGRSLPSSGLWSERCTSEMVESIG